jgi:hypothetical protein
MDLSDSKLGLKTHGLYRIEQVHANGTLTRRRGQGVIDANLLLACIHNVYDHPLLSIRRIPRRLRWVSESGLIPRGPPSQLGDSPQLG